MPIVYSINFQDEDNTYCFVTFLMPHLKDCEHTKTRTQELDTGMVHTLFCVIIYTDIYKSSAIHTTCQRLELQVHSLTPLVLHTT